MLKIDVWKTFTHCPQILINLSKMGGFLSRKKGRDRQTTYDYISTPYGSDAPIIQKRWSSNQVNEYFNLSSTASNRGNLSNANREEEPEMLEEEPELLYEESELYEEEPELLEPIAGRVTMRYPDLQEEPELLEEESELYEEEPELYEEEPELFPPSPCQRRSANELALKNESNTDSKIENAKPDKNTGENGASSSIIYKRERSVCVQLPKNQTRNHMHRYEEMIIINKPMIISKVIAAQVLPHLQTCLNERAVGEIKDERNTHKATEILLEKLKESEEPGKWKMFVQALEKCKYKTVTKALRREDIPNTEYEKEILRITPQLREMIKPTDIMAELLKEDIINCDDKSEILQKKNSDGDIVAMDLLLDRIPRKHPKWFSRFIKALRSINRSDLADMLLGNKDSRKQPERQDRKVQPDEKEPCHTEGKEDDSCDFQENCQKILDGTETSTELWTANETYINTDWQNKNTENKYQETTTMDSGESCENVKTLQEQNNRLSSMGSQLDLKIKELEKMAIFKKENNEKQRKINSLAKNISELDEEDRNLKEEYTDMISMDKNGYKKVEMYRDAWAGQFNRHVTLKNIISLGILESHQRTRQMDDDETSGGYDSI